MSEIEANNPTAVEEERYWNPEEDMYFTVLSVGDQLGAVGQYENGESTYIGRMRTGRSRANTNGSR